MPGVLPLDYSWDGEGSFSSLPSLSSPKSFSHLSDGGKKHFFGHPMPLLWQMGGTSSSISALFDILMTFPCSLPVAGLERKTGQSPPTGRQDKTCMETGVGGGGDREGRWVGWRGWRDACRTQLLCH